MDSLLVALVEFDGGERVIGMSGPSAITRLATASKLLSEALTRDIVRENFARLPPPPDPTDTELKSFALVPATLTSQVKAEGAEGFLPDPRILVAFCRLSATASQATPKPCSTAGLDELFRWLAHGVEIRPDDATWARALGRDGVACMLERARPEAAEETHKKSLGPKDIDELSEDLFKAIENGSVTGLVRKLAAGAPLDATGPKMFQGDPGCCSYSPLASAANYSGRRRHASQVVALLMAARANADGRCHGPCGWTPLMCAARAGAGAAESCRLLVMCQADVRRREATSNKTALEMGDKETSRAIRDARDERAKMPQLDEATLLAKSSASGSRAGAGGYGKQPARPMPPQMASALASALAPPSKGKGRGGRKR